MLAELHGPELKPTGLIKGLSKACTLEYNVLPSPGLQSSLSPAVPSAIKGNTGLQSKTSRYAQKYLQLCPSLTMTNL